MPTPPLPQEIFDKLVDCASPDFEDLKQLALTSPRFVERSQSHLFRKLTIDTNIRQAKRNILEQKPTLFKHCRELTLTFDLTIPPAHALGRADRQISLSRIVDELQGLTKVSIRSYSNIRWDDVSPLCQAVIVKLLDHPIHHLFMAAFRVLPLHLVYPRLVSTVESCRFCDISFGLDDELPGKCEPFKVTTLVCDGRAVGSMLQLARSRASSALANVTSLSLHVGGESNEESHPEALALVSQASSTLKVLKLDYPYFLSEVDIAPTSIKGFALPTIPTLQYLYIRSSTTFFVDDLAYPIHPTIPRFLHGVLSANPQPALEVIAFKISWITFPISLEDIYEDHQTAPPVLHDWQRWVALDEVLSSPSRYPSLRGVQFTPDMTYTPIAGNRDSEAENAFVSSMPTKFQSEILAAMEATRKRLPVFVPCTSKLPGIEETDAEKLFEEMRATILNRTTQI